MASQALTNTTPNITQGRSYSLIISFNVTLPIKLESDNFLVWQAQIFSTIRGQKLEGFINGAIKPPKIIQGDKASEEAWDNWFFQDQFLLQLIYSSIFREVLNQLVRCTTSFDAWQAIERIHSPQSQS